jgi:hypothetical protein
MPFKGKSSMLNLASPKTIYHKEMKIGMVDKAHEFNKCDKFQLATFRGSAAGNT